MNIIKKGKEGKPVWTGHELKRIEKRQKAMSEDDAIALVKLIRSYCNQKERDHLSIADNNWLKKAEQYLCSEIAEVLKIEFEKAVFKITEK